MDISWKLESSTTAASFSEILSISGKSGLPIFPPRWTVLPAALSISEIIVVVVVFPSLPVTAKILQGHKSKKVSISEVTAAPRARASFNSGI